MKLRIYTFAIILFAGIFTAHAQNNVGINTNTPDASAALDISSTSQGVLVPRMTKAQRDIIATPATGLLVYQTDNIPGFYFFNGTMWTSLSGGGSGDNLGNHTATQALNMGNNNITSANTITTNTLNIKEISVGSTGSTGSMNLISLVNSNATSSEIDATGKTFIRLKSSSGIAHVICGIAGGYEGKILYLGLSTGFTWATNSTAETITTNRLSDFYLEPFTQDINTGPIILKLIYMTNVENGQSRWVVIDQNQ